jgi:hypothetical protein
MKYTADMGSDAMTYILSFMKIGSGIQNFIEGIHAQAYTESNVISQI